MITKKRLAQLRRLIKEGRENLFYSWPEWKQLSADVVKMDRYECQKCRARGKYRPAELVHHVQHLKDRPELALSVYDPDTERRQLVSLCRPCHEEEHPERLRPAWTTTQRETVSEERWD